MSPKLRCETPGQYQYTLYKGIKNKPKLKRSTARKPSKRDKDKRRDEEIELRLNESAMVRCGERDRVREREREAGRQERVRNVRKSVQDRRNALTVSGWEYVCVCVCCQLRKRAQMRMQEKEIERERESD